MLLRRIYSDEIPPREGIPIDTPGGIPDGYAGSDQARFEQAIWSRFWTLASDPGGRPKIGDPGGPGRSGLQADADLGEAYELRVEAAGGMTLVPIADVVGRRRRHDSERVACPEIDPLVGLRWAATASDTIVA